MVSVEQFVAVPIDTEFSGRCSGDSMTVAAFLVIKEVDMIK